MFGESLEQGLTRCHPIPAQTHKRGCAFRVRVAKILSKNVLHTLSPDDLDGTSPRPPPPPERCVGSKNCPGWNCGKSRAGIELCQGGEVPVLFGERLESTRCFSWCSIFRHWHVLCCNGCGTASRQHMCHLTSFHVRLISAIDYGREKKLEHRVLDAGSRLAKSQPRQWQPSADIE